MIFGKSNLFESNIRYHSLRLTFILLLFYSSIYYGGLYQNTSSIGFWNALIFIIAMVFLVQYLGISILRNFTLPLIIVSYIMLSVWTITNSPQPHVDAFIQQKEAPLKLLQGINPYNTHYTKVYLNVDPNYFGYLPFSFIYHVPFVLLFSDPRYSIAVSNLISAFVIYKLFSMKKRKDDSFVFIALFLFLPRSFYVLEHMYLDPIIFSFFLLFFYYYMRKNYSKSIIFLSLFFSFKQHLIMLYPLLFKHIYSKLVTVKNILIFSLPFLLPLYFFLREPDAFLRNVIFFFNPQKIPAPVSNSLSFSTFLTHYFPILSHNSIFVSFVLFILFFIIYAFVIANTRNMFFSKLVTSLLLFNFLMFHSFYNHYYLVALFLLFDIMNEFLTINV